NQAGSGPGIAFNANSQLLGLTLPLHPGDVGVLYGTGLGNSPGDNYQQPPQQVNLKDQLGVKVYIGGQSAVIDYAGRTIYSGEDQINFHVPSGAIGCHVSVAVQIGNIVSNFVTIPVAAAGSNVCSDPVGPTTS